MHVMHLGNQVVLPFQIGKMDKHAKKEFLRFGRES